MSVEAEIKILTQYKTWEKPECFHNAEQFKDYMWMVKRVRQPPDEENYCMDCTKEYQAQMVCEGKCAHPETRFITWRTTYKDPETIGTMVSNLNEPDVIGISKISRFWGSPSLD